MVHYCSELECLDEQEEDDKQTITNDMEHDVIPVTISQSVPITSVTTTTHYDHNLSLPTHHHHQDHHNIVQQHSSKGVCVCVCGCVCTCAYECTCFCV